MQIRVSVDEWKQFKNRARSLSGSENVSAFIRTKCLSSDLTQEEMVAAIHKKLVTEHKGDAA